MKETAISSERVFEGRLLKIDVVSVELDDGTRSSREIVRHPGAAVIVCRKLDGRFVFVRQYRLAARSALLEATAGAQPTDDDERVLVEEYSQAQIDDMITRGEIRDAKTLAAWLLFTCRMPPL